MLDETGEVPLEAIETEAIETEPIDGKYLLPGMGIIFGIIAVVGLITYCYSRQGKTVVKFHSKS